MSDFNQVIIWLNEKKVIYRKIWREKDYQEGLMNEAIVDGNKEPRMRYLYSLDDFNATDWEVVNE